MAYKKTVLDNGIRIVTERMPGVHSASLGLCFEVGSRCESERENGVCHFIEHMVFKGTRHRTARRIAQEMDSIGGSMDAMTGRESTLYYAKVQAGKVGAAMEILADILLHPLFDEKEMAHERQVVLEEIKMYDDTPDELIHDHFAQAVWRDHPLGRPVLGTREILRRQSRDQVHDFYRSHYDPSAMIAAAAGAVDHQKIVKLVRRHFGGLRRRVPAPAVSRPAVSAGLHFSPRKLEQVHFCLGGEAMAFRDPRRHAMTVLNSLLGSSMSSRLFQELREKRGLAYSVYSYHDAYRDTGLWLAYVGTSPGHFAEAVRVILDQLGRLGKRGVTAAELRRAKESLKGSLILGFESTSSRLSMLVRGESYFGRPFSEKELLDGFDRVQAGEVRDLAREYFEEKKLSLVSLGPVGPGDLKGLKSRFSS